MLEAMAGTNRRAIVRKASHDTFVGDSEGEQQYTEGDSKATWIAVTSGTAMQNNETSSFFTVPPLKNLPYSDTPLQATAGAMDLLLFFLYFLFFRPFVHY